MQCRLAWVLVIVALVGCGDDDGTVVDGGASDAWVDPGEAIARFDPEAIGSDFFAFPFPSDLRLEEDGTPDLAGYPNPRGSDLLNDLLPLADERRGWPVVPAMYVRFSAPLGARSADDVIAAERDAPILLVDVDPDSSARGALVPVVAATMPEDGSTGAHLLAVSPRPGFVLAPDRTYALVVMRALGDALGRPLGVPDALATLARGETPDAPWGARAAEVYAPLFETLAMMNVDVGEVAAATVLTTGDVVADLHAMSERVLAAHDVTIESLALEHTWDRYCELRGTISMPQMQRGTPPFATEGTFELDAAGTPIEQRRETVPVVITIPRGEMPASGWPLMVYFHGSGGVASQVVDRGPRVEGGEPAAGEGPAHVIAAHGFAAVGAALPLSPDRVPGAGDTAYLNLENLGAFRDTFRQGALESRLLVEAMTRTTIAPEVIASCGSAGEHRFDGDAFVALGQSMGGMYTNIVGAIEPRFRALVPTGAGGYWSYFILETSLVPGAAGLLGALLGANGRTLTHLHPALFLLELAWEPAEPLVYMPRLSRRPLEGVASRPVYEPVGEGDSYFPTRVYDAVALAYGHEQAGDVVWSSMQDALALDGREGVLGYPVHANRTSERGDAYTGVVVQYAGDGFSDPHDIFVQLEAVRHQYGCFLRSVIEGRGGVVVAPGANCGE
ncbi:hypothetical protein [Sandaracinus amylolyticus]|uniref:hypothetical protein n=1 Tax=Sandaracinus amylolyticus TaxID=927083 RepID=UPI001F353077|nr:hypothetical protein [Sandaracinus amylolyticus]UJR86315.1 Hypothetical protein I5071_83990 [Sandaracinus amylolyticus]